jgi:hypothetical protein
MNGNTIPEAPSILADQARYLIATAARAPSVHNTQPWRFRVGRSAIELHCDPRRKLRVDPAGREMLISCGAALFGLRLAIRSLGYQPVVELLPDPGRVRLLARVMAGPAESMTVFECEMLKAVPHRHTHRGGFAPVPLPAGLLAGLRHDARAEGARVFASLYTQPLEAAAIRALIRDRLGLPSAPQMLLQLGVAHTAHATGRLTSCSSHDAWPGRPTQA